jgi:acyl-CoA thioester hydrolase
MSPNVRDERNMSPLPLRERVRVRGMVAARTTATAPATAPSPQPSPARGEGAKPGEGVKPFSIPVRIYYEDTDVGAVVYYANYLRYLERARTEWLRAAGFELDVIQRDMKAVFVVRRVEADYHLPALLGNMITVTAEPTEVGASKLVIRQRVLRGDELLLSAVVTLAFIASDLSGPIRMPPALRAAMKSTILPIA